MSGTRGARRSHTGTPPSPQPPPRPPPRARTVPPASGRGRPQAPARAFPSRGAGKRSLRQRTTAPSSSQQLPVAPSIRGRAVECPPPSPGSFHFGGEGGSAMRQGGCKSAAPLRSFQRLAAEKGQSPTWSPPSRRSGSSLKPQLQAGRWRGLGCWGIASGSAV